VEIHGQQLAARAVHEALKVFKLRKVGRIGVAERKSYERNASLRGRFQCGKSNLMNKLPKPRLAEFEYGAREVDRGVIVQ
jgi:hypothetical protein